MPFCFYLHFFAMGFFSGVYWNIKNMQKLMNLNCTVAQLILSVPHIQEFLVCALHKYGI